MNITYSRAILYSDATDIETGVSFDPTYRLSLGDASYVHIKGVGEEIPVRVDHIPHLIKWLNDVVQADAEYRATIAKEATS